MQHDPEAPRHAAPSWRNAPDVPLDLDGPTVPFRPFCPVAGPETPILDLLRATARAAPGAVAIQDGLRTITYRRLIEEAEALGRAIAAVAEPGRPVAIRLPDGADGPVAMLACLFAGVPSVPIDRADPPERVQWLVAAAGLAAAVTDEPIPGLPCILRGATAGCQDSARVIAQGAPAFIVFTSGSTGQPKGIVHSQRSVLHRAGLLVNSGHLHPGDAYLSLNVPASMGALLNAVAAWLAGATLHRVAAAAGPLDLGRALHHIRAHAITAMIGVPAVYRALTRLSGAGNALRSLRLVSSNGEALLTADLAQMRAVLPEGCHVQMVYGATEAQAGLRFVPAGERGAAAQVAAGRPVPGTQFAIQREDGAEAAAGEAGTLRIRSRYTAIGEWRDGGCVPGRLRPDGDPASGWRSYVMGDAVRLREDGVFVVIGREDRQLKINGVRVEPVEVEAVLREDPGVLDAAVLPVPGLAGTHLVAFVATSGSAAPDGLRQRLQTLMAARLTAAMRPRRLHLVQALPLLPGNKVDAAELCALDQARRGTAADPGTPYRAPRDAAEALLCALFAEVIGGDRVGIDDGFFALGGSSLGAMLLLARLRQETGRDLPLRLFFERPTPGGFAQALAAGATTTGDDSPLLALQPQGDRTPFFCVHSIGGGILHMRHLAEAMGTGRPFLGLRGTPADDPTESVEQMAARYVAAVLARQPAGPFLLGGYSFGGVVAYEMARQLTAAGHKVALLAILDARWPLWRIDARTALPTLCRWLANLPGYLQDEAAQFSVVRLRGQVARTLRGTWRLLRGLPADLESVLDLSRFEPQAHAALQAHLRAAQAYRPLRCDLPIEVFRASVGLIRHPCGDAALGWGAVADRTIRVHRIPGNHVSMIAEPRVKVLADALSRALDRRGEERPEGKPPRVGEQYASCWPHGNQRLTLVGALRPGRASYGLCWRQ